MAELSETLIQGARQIGVELPDTAVEGYLYYIDELKRWNQRINLTAIKGDVEIAVKHFLDSLTVAQYMRMAKTVLDVGTGAGFPGLPLKILLPSIHVVLLDASQKRIFFLRHIIRGLDLHGVEAVHGRAEQEHVIAKYKRSFDLVISRAVTPLSSFLSLALPYVRKGGLIVGMRGKKGQRESESVDCKKSALRLIGTKTLQLPILHDTRVLLVYQLPAALNAESP